MTIPKKEVDRLIDTLSRSWDGYTDGDEQHAIEEFIHRYGDEGVEALTQISCLHLELQRIVESSQVYEQAMDRVRTAASFEAMATDSPPRDGLPSAPPLRVFGAPIRLRPLLLVAASLLAVAALPWLVAPRGAPDQATKRASQSQLFRPSTPVATVVSLEGATWVGGDDIHVGCNLKQDRRLELSTGQAHLSMVCGADIVLQAPCIVTLTADDEVDLERGTLTAQAAKWATGFVVNTQDLQVTDLGTRFAVSTDGSGVVEAHVLEGEILAEPLKHRRPRHSSMLLESGQAIRVDPFKSRIDLMAARRADFVGEIEDFRPLRPISMWNTGVGLKPGDTDSRWRLVSGSEIGGPYPRGAVVTIGDTGSYKDNKPEVSQWISIAEESYPGVPPESLHTFQTSFELNGYDLDTVYIVGQILVDDAINELRINGHSVPFKRWVTTWDEYDFMSFHPIEIFEGFVEGTNVVEIDVFNSPSNPRSPEDLNPTGLRVEWQAFGCESR